MEVELGTWRVPHGTWSWQVVRRMEAWMEALSMERAKLGTIDKIQKRFHTDAAVHQWSAVM
jgi:hypothetical protein